MHSRQTQGSQGPAIRWRDPLHLDAELCELYTAVAFAKAELLYFDYLHWLVCVVLSSQYLAKQIVCT